MHGLSFPRQTTNYWREVPNAKQVAIEHFSPQMFVICMGTGILAILLHQNPHQFRGLDVISIVGWIIYILLLTFNFLGFLTRWISYPQATINVFLSDVEQRTYLSSMTISMAVGVEMVSLIAGSSWDDWQYVSFALWWCVVFLSVSASVTTYWLLNQEQDVHLSNVGPTLMLPVTGLLACASSGTVLVQYTPLSIKLAQPVLITSYVLLGAGFILSLMTITSYFVRLLFRHTPEPKKIAGHLLPVAAFSNASYSYIALSYLAGPKRNIFSQYGKGPVAQTDVANAMYGAGFVFGLTIFGFATFWLLLASVAFIRDVRKTHFTINMWSATYPLGAYGVACSHLASDLDSPAFKVFTSIVLIILVLYWLVLIVNTLAIAISGALFLEEVKEQMDQKKKNDEPREEYNLRHSSHTIV